MSLPDILQKLTKGRQVRADDHEYFAASGMIKLAQDEKDELNTYFQTRNDGSATRQFQGDPATYTLVIEDATFLWRKPLPRVVLQHENLGFEWLTYETVINNPSFRRTNQVIEIPLYSVSIDKLDIWMRQGVEGALNDALSGAFFPDLPAHGLGIISRYSWPWKNTQFMRAETAIDVGKRPASRGTQAVVLPARAILPYNPYDNHAQSCALGTTQTHVSMKQVVDACTWKLWKTASRSAVVELKRVKKVDEDWDAFLKTTPYQWAFDKGAALRAIAADNAKLQQEIGKGHRLVLASLTPHHVSLKTGVCYVGAEDQSWAKIRRDGKDAIDGNWVVSCLRSDFVVETNLLMQARGYAVAVADQPLLVLTELLTIAEKDARTTGSHEAPFRDGVQVRDLSPLQKDRAYVFPGSIPFLATDNRTLAPAAYASRTDLRWRAFWREAWGASLGRAKALFVLRYGLQHKNPNPQNYLIELRIQGDALALPARVVIRDLQDAALHREAIWAFYGNGPVPTATDAAAELAGACKGYAATAQDIDQRLARTLQYEFETVAASDRQETGSTDRDFGRPGTRLAWWLFSTGKGMNQRGGASLEALKAEIGAPGQREVFAMLAEWGMAHDAAFVQCVEAELGVELRTIDWTAFPTQDGDIEEAAADAVHALFASGEGQAALAAYRRSAWKAAVPSATWTVLDAADRPLGWRTVLFENDDGSAKWSRPTDGQGRIMLFGRAPSATKASLHNPGGVASPLHRTGVSWKLA